MSAFAPTQLSGFNRYPVEDCLLARPESDAQLRRVVADAPHDYIPRGAGRGLGDNAINRGSGVVCLTRMDRLLAFDPQSGIVDCEGGCTFAKLIDTFLPRGFFPLVTPGTKHVTVGGAIAADVHGKNHHRDGSFSACVLHFDLLLPTGEVLRCSREANADAFWATLGGMGLTGTILTARIRLNRVESAFVTVEYEQATDLDDALRRFAEGDDRHRYSVAWIDCLAGGRTLGRSVLMRGDHTPASEVPPVYCDRPLEFRCRREHRLPFYLPTFAMNAWTVKAFNARFHRRHTGGRRVVDYDTFFYPLDRITNYDRLYGGRGFVQYQAVFPRETSRAGLAEMLAKLAESGRASFLAVLKSMGPADDGMLSFPMPGHTLALDLPYTGESLATFVAGLDDVVLRHGGRVYLAKDAFATRSALDRMYPRLPEFLRVKSRLDPGNRLRSSLARRLGLAGAGP